MPDISGSAEMELANSVSKLSLSQAKNRQCTGDGTSPQKTVGPGSHDGNSSPANEDWSNQVKDGVEPHLEEEDSDDESSGEGSDEDSSDEEEEIKAPIELIGEFLVYIRTSDWENAAKLCKMILIYEPNNPTALQFQTVIAEKAEIEKELAEMSSSDEEETSDEEDSDDEDSPGEDADGKDDEKDDSPDEFEPRPGSTMKNKLIFPHSDPVWKP